jgi:hypothetical protein
VCLPANLNGQFPLLQVETFVFAVMNMRWIAPAGHDRHRCHEKGAARLLAGDKKRNV